MSKYHKINAPFKRDMSVKPSPLIKGDFCQEEFRVLRKAQWVAHEKIDGTNIRVIWDGYKVEFKGRTDKAIIPGILLDFLKESFPIACLEEHLGNYPMVLYGEGISHKIQSGGKYFKSGKGVDFILFDIKHGHLFCNPLEVKEISKKLRLKTTPFYSFGALDELIEEVENGVKSQFGDFWAEGLIVKPTGGLLDRRGRRIITKIKHVDFYKGK